MRNLTNEELKNVDGGAAKFAIGLGIAAGITFIIGFIDGIVRPLKCN